MRVTTTRVTTRTSTCQVESTAALLEIEDRVLARPLPKVAPVVVESSEDDVTALAATQVVSGTGRSSRPGLPAASCRPRCPCSSARRLGGCR
jgi:hypothetical protein